MKKNSTNSPIVAATASFAAANRLDFFVVGGAVRDALLGRARPDKALNLDFAIPSGALAAARRLAAHLHGTYVLLDEEMGSARIIADDGGARIELDLSDFRGPTLEADLRLRDFTINAMAVPLAAWCAGSWESELVDPTEGRRDLAARTLRACFPGTFEEDPLRILRAFRFASELMCAWDPALPGLLQAAAPGLARVSGERIRDELFGIFHTDYASHAVREMERLGLIEVLFPELVPGRGMDQGGFHHLNVLEHQLETIAQCDRVLKDFAEFSPDLREPMARYVEAHPVEPRSIKAMIKLGGLLHDVGKPATKRVKEDGQIWFLGHEHFGAELVTAVGERLKLSNREAQTLWKLVLYHLRPGHLSRAPVLTRRAIFRFYRDLEEDGPACLFVWWADRLSTLGPLSHVNQIDQQRAFLEELFRAYFFKPEEAVRPPKLIDGNELMKELSLPPSPKIGTLLSAIQEAQAEGSVSSRDEALALARSLLASDG